MIYSTIVNFAKAANNVAHKWPLAISLCIVSCNPALAYEDRVIAQSALVESTATSTKNETGLPYSSRTSLGTLFYNNLKQDNLQLSHNGYLETPNHGTINLNAAMVKHGSALQLGNLSIWQYNYFINNHTQSTNAIGTINTPLASLLQNQARIMLPTAQILGMRSELATAKHKLHVSIGQLGSYAGEQFAGFNSQSSLVFTLGDQLRIGQQTSAAWQLGLNDQQKSVASAISWQGSPRQHLKLNHLWSDNHNGVWVDASYKRNNHSHLYGLHYIDPNVMWLGTPVGSSNSQGAYYHYDLRYQRWNASANINHSTPLTGAASNSQTTIQLYGRYQRTRQQAFGANLRQPFAGLEADQYNTFVEQNSTFGRTRVDVDYVVDDQQNEVLYSLDHQFKLPSNQRLSLGLNRALLREQGALAQSNQLYINAAIPLGQHVDVSGTIRLQQSNGITEQDNNQYNLGLEWSPSSQLKLLLTYINADGATKSINSLNNPINTKFSDQNLYLNLIYKHARGSSAGVIAGNASSPAGSIKGVVFYDSNQDGIQNANEQGIADQVVLLAGKYRAYTNVRGEWQFDRVAIGNHQVQCISDNLPLPWLFAQESQKITVHVRQSTWVNCAAIKEQ